jgi:hypothetical protein
MDKNTFSKYGAIICAVIIIAIMIAFATPFGRNIARGVVDAVKGFDKASGVKFLLKTPQDIKIEGNTLSFKTVKDADQYGVYINGTEVIPDLTDGSVDLASAFSSFEGSVIIEVIAKDSSGNHKNSFSAKLWHKLPGLYETDSDVLVKSWNTLVSEGILSAKGVVQDGKAAELVGDLIVPREITVIESRLFDHCTGLTSIKLPETVTYVSTYAFNSCTSLKSINLPDSIRTLNHTAFNGCKSLTSIVLPKGLTEIRQYTFWGCWGLESIEIPDTLTSIDQRVFKDCKNLTSISLPHSFTTMGTEAFLGCTGLVKINYDGTVAEWQNITLPEGWDTSTGDYMIHCTDGTIAKDGTVTYNQ